MRAKRIKIPVFSISSREVIRYSDIRVRKFNVLDRVKDRIANEIDTEMSKKKVKSQIPQDLTRKPCKIVVNKNKVIFK